MSKWAKKILRDESGQAITEYVLLMSIALGGAVVFSRGFLKFLDQFTLVFGAQLEKDLKSGRAPNSVWKN